MRYDLMMMKHVCDDILKFTPTNFVEIGSRDGHDTNFIRESYRLHPHNCYIFEAHPDCYESIISTYPNINTHHCAITSHTGPITFHAGVVGVETNVGCSSINRDLSGGFLSREVLVDGWRFEDVCGQLMLTSVDLMKIDVEGHTHEVLEGFGSMLQHVKIIQLELEHKASWENHTLYDDIAQFMANSNFTQAYFVKHSHDQSDSLWVNNLYFNL